MQESRAFARLVKQLERANAALIPWTSSTISLCNPFCSKFSRGTSSSSTRYVLRVHSASQAVLQVNMERPCPYWSEDAQCGSKECGIGYCDDEVPEALRRPLVSTAYRFLSPFSCTVMPQLHTNPTCCTNSPEILLQLGPGAPQCSYYCQKGTRG